MKIIFNIIFWAIFSLNIIRVMLIVFTELLIASGIMILGKILRSKKVFQYGLNVALSMDQWASTQFLGHPDETISSRLGRVKKHGSKYWWAKVLQVVVDFVADKVFGDKNHCEKSVIPEEQLAFKTFDYELWSWDKGPKV